MNDLKALDELIEAVKGGATDVVAQKTAVIASQARDTGGYWPRDGALRAFYGSLDAAKEFRDDLNLKTPVNIDARKWMLKILLDYRVRIARGAE